MNRPVRKVLLYSHDTFGLGHLRRNVKIATHLLGTDPGLRVVLMSGSPVTDRFTLPPRLGLVQLPPVVKAGDEDYRPRAGGQSIGLVRRARTAIMVDVARRFSPDVLLVDHAPAGMGGELRDVLDLLRSEQPGARVVLGLRDILDEPRAVVRTWAKQAIVPLLEQAYDQICVYGSREVFDAGRAYELPATLRERLLYCGYVVGPGAVGGGAGREPLLLATAGGGGDGVAVLDAAVDAGAALGLPTLVVSGPLMDEADRSALARRAAAAPDARVVEFVPDLRAVMASATAVVTMGGYNSMCEVIASGAPAVVVPRTAPRQEQLLRASLFARRGLVSLVPPGPELADRLAGGLARATTHRGGPRADLDIGGLDRLYTALTGAGTADRSGAAARHAAGAPMTA